MAMASVRSGLLRTALRGGSRPSAPLKRGFASSSHHDDAYETAKWEKITYLGVATCTVLAIYNLSKGHSHHEEPTPYSYLHIRNKEFPWGPDGLFEKKMHH
ncbi:cytochrome c oxidase subunit 6a, mitochondrial-like [Durio zibethinus]|uniref:Cytochrome c oxidase subunit 6a, mitochondrial-like n=1 Tax=Durio zibethinus TaxID=66656 RepID=A0A6P5YN50_DURZI|nr:cytochrome c oxidase subunit 6a, mitochondrial-like [Durio zibethinus]